MHNNKKYATRLYPIHHFAMTYCKNNLPFSNTKKDSWRLCNFWYCPLVNQMISAVSCNILTTDKVNGRNECAYINHKNKNPWESPYASSSYCSAPFSTPCPSFHNNVGSDNCHFVLVDIGQSALERNTEWEAYECHPHHPQGFLLLPQYGNTDKFQWSEQIWMKEPAPCSLITSILSGNPTELTAIN
jgi:hypothetical protein